MKINFQNILIMTHKVRQLSTYYYNFIGQVLDWLLDFVGLLKAMLTRTSNHFLKRRYRLRRIIYLSWRNMYVGGWYELKLNDCV